MSAESKIEWTDHTFNPWWGCEKVSPGCTHCYADTFAKRLGHGTTRQKLWGPGSERKVASPSYWRQPLAWDAAARREGKRARVFCASMADVFEDREDLAGPRARLFRLIEATTRLDWLLLTKRPENVVRLAAECSWFATWPANVWLGTTCEDQARADERIPHLLATPARVRFLSCEPLLEGLRLRDHLRSPRIAGHCVDIDGYDWHPPGECSDRWCKCCRREIDWVIVGGESGHGARPMSEDWVRSLRDQCSAAGVPFFYKQKIVSGAKVSLPRLDGVQHAAWPEVAALGGGK